MKKILLVIDGMNIDMSALDFACYLGRLTNSKITGVFLENLVADHKLIVKTVYGKPSFDWEMDKKSAPYIEKNEVIEKNIQLFKEACARRSATCSIHRDRGVPAKEIITESRYADLVVVDAATSFHKKFEGTPTEFVRDILKETECPVIVAPESFEGIDEIIVAYNGTKSSAFAIKQFSYLFPEFADKKIILLQVNETGVWADREKYNLKEWLQTRYSAIGFETLKGDTKDRLFDYLFKKKNFLLVMGAYGRSSVSRFFKHSHADRLMQTITQPIFISHY